VSPQLLLSTGRGSRLRGGEHLLKRARPYEGERALLRKGARPFGRGHVHFDLMAGRGRALFAEGAPLWKKGSSKVSQ
jgi:hypothetical protein